MGVRYEGTEVPERGDAILEAVTAAGAPLQPASPVDRDVLGAVHDDDLIAYLEHAWDDWVAAGYLEEPGQDRVVPYAFPIPGVSTGRIPTAMSARAGTFAFDTMTLIGPGSARRSSPPPASPPPPPGWSSPALPPPTPSAGHRATTPAGASSAGRVISTTPPSPSPPSGNGTGRSL